MHNERQNADASRATYLRLEQFLERLIERHEQTDEALRHAAERNDDDRHTLLLRTIAEYERESANVLRVARGAEFTALRLELQFTAPQAEALNSPFTDGSDAHRALDDTIQTHLSLAGHFERLAGQTAFESAQELLQSLAAHYQKTSRKLAGSFSAERSL